MVELHSDKVERQRLHHRWVKSTLGHGETMCARCWMTNREAAVLLCADWCDAKPDDLDEKAQSSEV